MNILAKNQKICDPIKNEDAITKIGRHFLTFCTFVHSLKILFTYNKHIKHQSDLYDSLKSHL